LKFSTSRFGNYGAWPNCKASPVSKKT
jgi:hypothetical protein